MTLAAAAAELEQRLAEIERAVRQPRAPLWEHFGAKAGDRSVDNAPAISKALAAGAQALGGVYYCSTTIDWPHRSAGALYGRGGTATIGYGRRPSDLAITIIESKADPIIRYHGSGGLIQDVVLEGDGTNTALLVLNDRAPPTGHLETRSLTINRCDRGIVTALEPLVAWATEFTHYSYRTHGVRRPYVVNGAQSCQHTLFAAEFRTGYEVCFEFTGAEGLPGCGGPLAVWGCYLGNNKGHGKLLSIANTDSGTGCYEIHGLHVDGWAENLVLVEHGRRAHRVRITSNASSSRKDADGDGVKLPTLADPPVVNREGRVEMLGDLPLVDVQIDLRNFRWPKEVA